MSHYAEQVAKTIIQQFGGNRAFQMIGLNSCTYGTSKDDDSILPSGNEGDVYVDIRFKAKAAKVKGKSPNGFRIIYDEGLDVYTVVFYRIHGMNVTSLKVLEHVYCDMIQDIFENTTKLYLSL